MKRLTSFAVLGAFIAQIAHADPILGLWQTEIDDGAYAHINMKPCGAAICGYIARSFNSEGEYQSPNLGRKLVIDMVALGDGKYSGQVWRPSNNKIYIGKIDFSGDVLKLRGCVVGGLFCAKQNWTRAK